MKTSIRPACGRPGDEKGDQVKGGRVGPLDVLEDEHQRAGGRQPPDDAEQQLQDPRWVPVGAPGRLAPVVELWHQAADLRAGRSEQRLQVVVVELRGQHAEHVHHRCVRESRLRQARRSRRRARGLAAARARATNSPTSRDLPTPASPPTSTVTASPSRTRASAASSAADSVCRPTRTGLTRLAAIAPHPRRAGALQAKKSPARGPRRAGFEIYAPSRSLSIRRCGTCARCGSWSLLSFLCSRRSSGWPALGDEQMVRVSPLFAHREQS